MTRVNYIKKHQHLFWYIQPEKIPQISNEVLTEFVFNYGTWEDVKELIAIIGYPELKKVYNALTGRKKGNYIPEMYDLLKRIVTHYAP